MNLFYAAFGSCRRSGRGKQLCYDHAVRTVNEYGRGGRRPGKRCKFGRTKVGKCRKARRSSR